MNGRAPNVPTRGKSVKKGPLLPPNSHSGSLAAIIYATALQGVRDFGPEQRHTVVHIVYPCRQSTI